MKLEVTKELSCGKLILEESLTLPRASEIKEEMLKALLEVDTLTLDHSEASEFDLSYLQILVSVRKYAEKNAKKVLFDINSPGTLNELVNECGLKETLS